MRSRVLCALSSAFACLMVSCSAPLDAPPVPMSFDGSSLELEQTEIVAVLDSPIHTGTNVIWCASFQAVWKALEKDIAGEPIALEGAPDLVNTLNAAADPRPMIPSERLYLATGWVPDGIIPKIQQDLKLRFPHKATPSFKEVATNGFLSYCYMEAGVKFAHPYEQSREPLVFTEGGGRHVQINSFGIQHADAADDLRSQARVLFQKGDTPEQLEFAVDLCADSAPSQVVVARIAPEKTLQATFARVQREIAAMPKNKRPSGGLRRNRENDFPPYCALTVPDAHWSIFHEFSEIEGKRSTNPKLNGHFLQARQDIVFRLDRSGAELRSEAEVNPPAGFIPDFVLDRPFLVYMKKRDAEMPYFVMWVDNTELLRPWKSNGATRPGQTTTAP